MGIEISRQAYFRFTSEASLSNNPLDWDLIRNSWKQRGLETDETTFRNAKLVGNGNLNKKMWGNNEK